MPARGTPAGDGAEQALEPGSDERVAHVGAVGLHLHLVDVHRDGPGHPPQDVARGERLGEGVTRVVVRDFGHGAAWSRQPCSHRQDRRESEAPREELASAGAQEARSRRAPSRAVLRGTACPSRGRGGAGGRRGRRPGEGESRHRAAPARDRRARPRGERLERARVSAVPGHPGAEGGRRGALPGGLRRRARPGAGGGRRPGHEDRDRRGGALPRRARRHDPAPRSRLSGLHLRVALAGAREGRVRLDPAADFAPDLDAAPREGVAALYLNYPSNPCSASAPPRGLRGDRALGGGDRRRRAARLRLRRPYVRRPPARELPGRAGREGDRRGALLHVEDATAWPAGGSASSSGTRSSSSA